MSDQVSTRVRSARILLVMRLPYLPLVLLPVVAGFVVMTAGPGSAKAPKPIASPIAGASPNASVSPTPSPAISASPATVSARPSPSASAAPALVEPVVDVVAAVVGAAASALPSPSVAAVVDPCAVPTDHVVPVTTTAQLKTALAAAAPGDRISLADGVYAGTFSLLRSGTALGRIRVCGSAAAVIDGGSTLVNYGFRVQASYVDFVGFGITNVQKGVVADKSSYDTFDRLTIWNTGDEGLHLRTNSKNNVVKGSSIHDTGKRVAGYGEGVYVGSANNNWCTYTACLEDRSDNNVVLGNRFWAVGAEAVDIKEGTVGGTVADNTFDGTGSSALSWVDVKGNSWTIRGNKGHVALRDGFLTSVAVAGWGTKNTFLLNTADVQGPGYGFNAGAGNVVACTNIVTAAAKGYSTLTCTR
jgi:hypothetical protein